MRQLMHLYQAIGIVCLMLLSFPSPARASILSPGNTPVPFSYVPGGVRQWNICTENIPDDISIHVKVLHDGKQIDTALTISISRSGEFILKAPGNCDEILEFLIELHDGERIVESQTLQLQPAPPHRPISYVSDLVDDLIRMNFNRSTGQFNEVSKPVFDSYFRRLQAQGVTRIIVWQSVFPLINDPANYKPQDWKRFEAQANAIFNCDELSNILYASSRLESYQWLVMLMRLRLSTDFDKWFTASAKEHGIKLTASYRPFEAALTKYYEIPTFNNNGKYLWGFLPGGSPALNYNVESVCFAHYREILKHAGRADEALVDRIEFGGISNLNAIAERLEDDNSDLELVVSAIPPMDETSFVLLQNADSTFKMCRFNKIAESVHAHQRLLNDASFRVVGNKLVVSDIKLPADTRYLFLRQRNSNKHSIKLPAVPEVHIYTKAGNILGRNNVYYAMNGDDPGAIKTRVAGIPNDAMFHTDFQAIEASVDYFRRNNLSEFELATGTLVIDLLPSYSMEMIDFNQAAARDFVIREMNTIMRYDAFDEIFINTRSHTQLGGSTGDGVDGVQPMSHYRLNGKNYFHYGRDRAYAPLTLGKTTAIQNADAELITRFQTGEWIKPCQTQASEYIWRYQRNKAIANGVEQLLRQFEAEFPDTRIRVVIPESEDVTNESEKEIASMPKPDGGVYGDYFRHVRGSLNHIPYIGEGMSMVDLSGLRIEPVFLGIRYAPDEGPLNAFVGRYINFLDGNLGSSYAGPKSFFYEAQETLRATGTERERTRTRREEIIRDLLARDEINEIILYESADWIFNVPISDRHAYGYGFLDD
ncbi:MAG: hypothetical protein ACJZ8O_08735 [Pirellulaceae bacterium]